MLQGTPLAPKSSSGRMWDSLKSQGISDRSMQMLPHQRWVFRCLSPTQTQAGGHPQECDSIHEQDPTQDSKISLDSLRWKTVHGLNSLLT